MGHLVTGDRIWNPLTLEFYNAELESEYRTFDRETNSSVSRRALLLSPLVYFAYSLFDYALLTHECMSMIYTRLATVTLISPFLIMAWHRPKYAASQRLLASLTFVYGISMSAGVQLYEQEYALYFVTGLVMTNTYSVLLLSLRLKQSVSVIAALSVICFVVVMNKFDSQTLRITSFHVLFTMGLFLSWAIYRLELAKRKQFTKQLELLGKQSELVKSESERANWLENTTNFLRHELRNSIRGISSSIEMFKRFNPAFSDNKYLRRSEQSVKLSNRLLSSVGSATELESLLTREERNEVDLNELINDYVNVIVPPTNSNQAEFAVDQSNCIVIANSDRLIQALDNLLSNAFDYAKPSSVIWIRLSSRDKFAYIEVINQGQSLPEDKASLFSAFVTRRGSETYTSDNMGIGLYVVKAILESYGGTACCEDLEYGSGAKFILSLPLAPK